MAKNVSRGVGGKEAKEEFEILSKILKTMEEGKDVRAGHWSAAEIEVINRYQLLSAKPVVYLCNLSEKNYILRKDPMYFLVPLSSVGWSRCARRWRCWVSRSW